MLTILRFSTSLDEALTSTSNLTSLVQRVLKSNASMSYRLRNLERMHPALAASLGPACEPTENNVNANSPNEGGVTSQTAFFEFAFEEDLQSSRAYRRVTLDESRISRTSSKSFGFSFLSGLSLSDVSNVNAITLPILPMELWNHHRYSSEHLTKTDPGVSSFDAWYNPPAMVGRIPRNLDLKKLMF